MYPYLKKAVLFFTIILVSATSILAQPAIQSFSPTSAYAGAVINIQGKGFAPAPLDNIVFFGAVKASVKTASTNMLTVEVPMGASYAPITVTVLGKTAYSSKAFVLSFSGGSRIYSVPGEPSDPGQNTFLPPQTFSTGFYPLDAEVADIDGDSKPDIVTVSSYMNGGRPTSFSVLRNTSESTDLSFQSKREFEAGEMTQAVAVGDLNGDGKLDIITSSVIEGNISVHQNISTSGFIDFLPRVNYPSGDVASYIAIKDLDEDGLPDVLVVCSGSNSVYIYKNKSSKEKITLAQELVLATDLFPTAAAVEDMDGDSKPDLVVTNQLSNNVSIFKNIGSVDKISFGSRKDFDSGGRPSGIVAGDLDGDNKTDICILHKEVSRLAVYKNASTVTSIAFSLQGDYQTGADPRNIALGDFTGDGKLDAFVSGIDNTVHQNISLSQTDILFADPLTTGLGVNFMDVLAADMDGDGKSDIVGTNFISETVSVLRNYNNEPGVADFTPKVAVVGELITIKGSGFLGATNVFIGGTPAASFSVDNATVIYARVPQTVSGSIKVVNSYGSGEREGYIYPGAPAIDSFSPAVAGLGDTIHISGANFINVEKVFIGETPAVSFMVSSTTELLAVVGSGSSGKIRVVTKSGEISSGTLFRHFSDQPPPKIFSFSPAIATTGSVIELKGQYFLGTRSVSFGESPAASFRVLSDSVIYATIGNGSTGDVLVTTWSAAGLLQGFTFRETQVPVISTFSPTSGVVGTIITIEGNNFGDDPSKNIVHFGTTKASVISASKTKLQVTLPYAASFAPISVLNTELGLTAFSQHPYMSGHKDGHLSNANSFSEEVLLEFLPNEYPTASKAGDIDGDGKLDIIVSNMSGSYGYSARFYRNESTSSSVVFSSPVKVPNFFAEMYKIMDLDGDDRPEIFGAANSPKILLLQNLSEPGNLAFGEVVEIPIRGNSQDIGIADLNNDGKPDLVIAIYNSFGLTILMNKSTPGNIKFEELSLPYINNNIYPTFIAVTDIDGDNKPDILFTKYLTNNLTVLRNLSTNEQIAFGSPIVYQMPSEVFNSSIGDVNGDGRPDILVSTRDKFLVFKNVSVTGGILFEETFSLPQRGTQGSMSMADFSGDGRVDLVCNQTLGRTVVFENTSNGMDISFAKNVELASGNVLGGDVADINADGKLDIIVPIAGYSKTIIYLNQTDVPLIDSFFPTAAKIGDTIRIRGKNFYEVKEVNFFGAKARSFDVISDKEIIAIVDTTPITLPDVEVVTSKGKAGKEGLTFIHALKISSFEPIDGGAGTVVSVYGNSFGGVKEVSFGGVSAISFKIDYSGKITAVVGKGASGDVVVKSDTETYSLGGFTYHLPPIISGIDPITSRIGLNVSIFGRNLGKTSSVTIGGVRTFFSIKEDSLVVLTIDHKASGDIVLTTPGGAATFTGFINILQPSISSFTPVRTGEDSIVIIKGVNLNFANKILFGNVPAKSFRIISDVEIHAVVGRGASGSIIVQNIFERGGYRNGFEFIEKPNITSFSPAISFSEQTVSLTGTDLSNATNVLFGGVPAKSFIVNSSSSISAIVGSGASGEVLVKTPGGISVKSGFTYIPPPSITNFYPRTAAVGDTIFIEGENFKDILEVWIGNASVQFEVVHAKLIKAKVHNASTSGKIMIKAPYGVVQKDGFELLPLPLIHSFTPTSAQKGSLVTINGANFVNVKAVSFGGIPASAFSVVSPTQIQAEIGEGASGAVKVNTIGGEVSMDGFIFLVDNPEESPALQAYPNPTSGIVLIRHPMRLTKTNITVLDNAGTIIKRIEINGNTNATEINLSGLPAGIYSVLWSDGEIKRTTKVMLK